MASGKSTLYSDLNLFQPQVKPMVVGINAINQSLAAISATDAGERLFRPTFGANISGAIQELSDEDTKRLILTRLQAAYSQWDPRVEVLFNKSDVSLDPDSYQCYVKLVYTILGLGVFEEEFNLQMFLRSL